MKQGQHAGIDRQEKARLIVEAAQDKKAEDVVALDVRELVSFADTFVIATGSSDRHVRSIVDGIEEALRAAGERPLGIEGEEDGRWVLPHFGLPNLRERQLKLLGCEPNPQSVAAAVAKWDALDLEQFVRRHRLEVREVEPQAVWRHQ